MYRNPDSPDGQETLEPNASHELRDGDSVKFLRGHFSCVLLCQVRLARDVDSVLHGSVSWVPLILCFASGGTAQAKAGHLQQAQSLGSSLGPTLQFLQLTPKIDAGVKVAYRNFLPHHTHLLTKTLGPSFQLLLAAMRCANVCSPAFFEILHVVGKLDARSAACPHIPPGTGPVDAALEKAILKVDTKAGYDVRRHWGHAFLEDDWGALKPPTDPAFACDVNPEEPAVDTVAWNRNEQRKSLFKNILFVSFRGEVRF